MSRRHDDDSSNDDGSQSQSNSGMPSSSRIGDFSSLRGKAIGSWSCADVAAFLNGLRLDEFVPIFVREAISGPELSLLTDEDLRELGVVKFGPRKRILNKVKMLNEKGVKGTDELSNSEVSEESDSTGELVKIQAVYKKAKADITVRSTISLKDLQKELYKHFAATVKLRMRDEEDDLIPISNDRQLNAALRGSTGVVRFTCSKLKSAAPSSASKSSKSNTTPTKSSKSGDVRRTSASAESSLDDSELSQDLTSVSKEYSAMDSVSDAVVVINEDGIIIYTNPATSKLLEYTKPEMLKHNVKMLMPDTYARKHDGYLAAYLATGVAKVIGRERTVMAKSKAGKMIPVTLNISESKSSGDSTRFVGVLKRVSPPANPNSAASGSAAANESPISSLKGVLDLLQEPACVINEEGDVLVYNPAAEKVWGYPQNQVIGKKIDMLMPSPHRENHDYYLQRYVATNERRVMGSSRDVAVQLASGKVVPMNLALSEQMCGSDRVFVGMFRTVKEVPTKSKKSESVLQIARKMILAIDFPAAVINEKGIILGFNQAAEKFFGHSAINAMGQNVKMLMPAAIAEHHDGYLQRYLDTKVKTVIGKDRKVFALQKSGKEVECMLSVSEVEDENGNKIFTGLVYPPETKRR